MPELDFGKITRSNIRIKSHSEGGRVKTIKIGRKIVSGADIRGALGLYSARFKISFKGQKITITSSGSGHGVGMSQYGANGMAKKGETYKKILSHYYKGTTAVSYTHLDVYKRQATIRWNLNGSCSSSCSIKGFRVNTSVGFG